MNPTPFVIACLLAVAPAAAQDAAKKPEGDLGKLQGRWKAMIGPEKNIPVVATIEGRKITVKITPPEASQAYEMQGELKLDDKASPPTVDWVGFRTPNGDEAEINRGIYKFSASGDRWTICNGGPGNPRPAEFKQGENGPPNIIEFDRVKPGE
ncbi:MAG: TIGR03067 domain-containing protein [Isosphaeraceae bacterium]